MNYFCQKDSLSILDEKCILNEGHSGSCKNRYQVDQTYWNKLITLWNTDLSNLEKFKEAISRYVKVHLSESIEVEDETELDNMMFDLYTSMIELDTLISPKYPKFHGKPDLYLTKPADSPYGICGSTDLKEMVDANEINSGDTVDVYKFSHSAKVNVETKIFLNSPNIKESK